MEGKLKFELVAKNNWEVFDDDGYVITIGTTLKEHIEALQKQVEELKELLKDAIHWNSNVNAQEKIDWDKKKEQTLKE